MNLEAGNVWVCEGDGRPLQESAFRFKPNPANLIHQNPPPPRLQDLQILKEVRMDLKCLKSKSHSDQQNQSHGHCVGLQHQSAHWAPEQNNLLVSSERVYWLQDLGNTLVLLSQSPGGANTRGHSLLLLLPLLPLLHLLVSAAKDEELPPTC